MNSTSNNDQSTCGNRRRSSKANIPTRLSSLASARSVPENEVELGPAYQLQLQDVICGPGREWLGHPGNGRHRVLMEMRLGRYCSSDRVEKTRIVKEVVDAVRESGGNFVRCSSGVWYDVGNNRAREKTGSTIRALAKSVSNREGKRTPRMRPSPSAVVPLAASDSEDVECDFAVDDEMESVEIGNVAPGFAFSSSDGHLGIMEPDPIGTLSSRLRKPDGFDEFVRSTFLQGSNENDYDVPHKTSNPSNSGDEEEYHSRLFP